MILFCNPVCVNVHTICDDKISSCKKSFSWLGQKVNKKIDAYGHDADDSGPDLCPWPRDDAASRQDISTPFSSLIEFEATEYSCSIRYSIRIRNFMDILFELNSIFVPSLVSGWLDRSIDRSIGILFSLW